MGEKMILPDFILPSRINQCWQHSGMDCLEHCFNKKHFKNYPYSITYQYNSRGFRDSEWPTSTDELQNSVWCVGDSFTVGLGSPREHTWTHLLQQIHGSRTINVSMDGASNNWIARKSIAILQEINPKQLIIQWSYIARRELDITTELDQPQIEFYNDIHAPVPSACTQQTDQHPLTILNNFHRECNNNLYSDELRRLRSVQSSAEEDIKNTMDCINLTINAIATTKVVHSFIPRFVPKQFCGVIESQTVGLVIPEIKRLDVARDGHHYDQLTSEYFVDQVMKMLK